MRIPGRFCHAHHVCSSTAGREPAEPKALENFRFEADGKEIKAAVRKDDGKLGTGDLTLASWHVVKIPFAAGQTRRVKANYRNPYHQEIHHTSEDWAEGSPTLTYAFSAAALWAGPIKQGTVIVNAMSVDPAKVQFSHPKRYVFDKSRWTWSFTDFEPTLEDDLMINTRPLRQGFSETYLAEGGEWKEDGLRGAKWFALPRFKATASSRLQEKDGTVHEAKNVNDWDRATAWVEGQEGQGIGESLTLKLNTPGKVQRLGIRNGYTKSQALYLANSRIRQLLVSVNGGKAQTVDVADEYLEVEYFWFDLPKSSDPVETIRLEIASVYPGTTYADTAISGIQLMQPLNKVPKIQPAR